MNKENKKNMVLGDGIGKNKGVNHWSQSRQNDYYKGAKDFIEWLLSNDKYAACTIDADENCIVCDVGFTEDMYTVSTDELFKEFQSQRIGESMAKWKKFGQWTSNPSGKSRSYLSGAYWNGESNYAIVVCPWSRHCQLKPRYDIYRIPDKFKGDALMICHLKNPLKTDIDTLNKAIEHVRLLEEADIAAGRKSTVEIEDDRKDE